MIHQRENALMIYQILSTYFSRKCMEISLANRSDANTVKLPLIISSYTAS